MSIQPLHEWVVEPAEAVALQRELASRHGDDVAPRLVRVVLASGFFRHVFDCFDAH